MIDLDDVCDALRAWASGTVVATTGLATLEATTTGFTRAVGSFIDDKFRRGMEIVSSGFPAADNVRAVITSVSPLDMRVQPFTIQIANNTQTLERLSLVASVAAPNRSIVAGLPNMRSWENEAPPGLTTFTPIIGIPYLEEELSSATSRTIGSPNWNAWMEIEADYIIKWHGIAGVGSSALRKASHALKVRFRPGTIIPVGSSDAIVVNGDPAATEENIVQTTSGPVLVSQIPWHIRSFNTAT